MSDAAQRAAEQTRQAGQVFDYALGGGGVAMPWWIPMLHDVSEIAIAVTAVGGAVLVLLRIWLLQHGRPIDD